MPPLRVPSGLLDCVDFSEQSLTAMQQSYVLRGCTGATVNLWGKKEWHFLLTEMEPGCRGREGPQGGRCSFHGKVIPVGIGADLLCSIRLIKDKDSTFFLITESFLLSAPPLSCFLAIMWNTGKILVFAFKYLFG